MKPLSVGIGCRSGSSAAQIEAAVRAALGGRTFAEIGAVGSVDIKATERGLLDFCGNHALALHCFTRAQIATLKVSEPSAAAREHLGVNGVCEPCALLAAAFNADVAARSSARLLVRKTVLDGITVAIACADAASAPSKHETQPYQDLP